VRFHWNLTLFCAAENAAGQYGGNSLQTLIGCHVIRISDVSHVRTDSWERAVRARNGGQNGRQFQKAALQRAAIPLLHGNPARCRIRHWEKVGSRVAEISQLQQWQMVTEPRKILLPTIAWAGILDTIRVFTNPC
jgi:hypothetical protein